MSFVRTLDHKMTDSHHHEEHHGHHHKKVPAPLSKQELDEVPLLWRDRCAAYLKPLNDCRLQTFSLPWKCDAERNAFMKCEADYWRERAALANELKLADLEKKAGK
eukprot:TRINITY_DN1323_c0_g1_i1.p1 TRINITY_DN1323_c0_g1~~TRINITY_DN1323_c0_g1_i1.p1  ORF type:complete len:106 (-),score=23.82 TRINITY_DN1323_c0_g1_i1:24-341(-)